jgi:pyruvate formate lyase activating enzyme
VRGPDRNGIELYTYGRCSGFCVGPVEKKPLHHFLPGSAVLSFATAGCNLACRCCQNWHMSKSREMDTLADAAAPEALAATARRLDCDCVAFTYNDPTVFLEYAIDAANVDLKAFTERFYRSGSELAPVLETLVYLKRHTTVWLEITTLLIPGENDTEAELDAMTQWIARELGPDVPLHFTAFHPDWKMTDRPATPPATLHRARAIALGNGLHYVYTGNIRDTVGGTTWCPHFNARLIERDGYRLGRSPFAGTRPSPLTAIVRRLRCATSGRPGPPARWRAVRRATRSPASRSARASRCAATTIRPSRLSARSASPNA